MPVNLGKGKRIIVKKQKPPGVREAFHKEAITNQHIHILKQDEFRAMLTQCWPQTDPVI